MRSAIDSFPMRINKIVRHLVNRSFRILSTGFRVFYRIIGYIEYFFPCCSHSSHLKNLAEREKTNYQTVCSDPGIGCEPWNKTPSRSNMKASISQALNGGQSPSVLIFSAFFIFVFKSWNIVVPRA